MFDIFMLGALGELLVVYHIKSTVVVDTKDGGLVLGNAKFFEDSADIEDSFTSMAAANSASVELIAMVVWYLVL